MRHTHTKIAHVALRLALSLALGIAFLAAIYIRFYSGLIPISDLPYWPAYVAYFVLSVTLWTALESRAGIIYRCFEERSLGRWAWSLSQLDLLTLAIVSSAAFFWRGYSFSRYTVALFWSLHVALGLVAASVLRAWVRRREGVSTVHLFLIGDDVSAAELRRQCLAPLARVVERPFVTPEQAVAALAEFDPPAGCREILVALPAARLDAVPPLSDALRRLPAPASIAIEGLAAAEAHATPSFLVLSTGPQATSAFDYVFSKRIIDLAVSALGLVVLSPVLAVIAAITWLRSGAPVLLAQERVGRRGRRFRLYKFRTLPVAHLADEDRRWNAEPSDIWGRFLRATGLDELPQLFNVLKGEMSLVGPRPERPHFVEQFRRELPFYSTRHCLQVGITGWAQVNGWRGDTSIPQRVEHDLYYLRHWSLALDFRILWMTLAGFFRHVRSV